MASRGVTYRSIQPMKAIRAVQALIANPDDTAQVFRVIRALTGWPAYAVTALGIIITGFTWAHTHHGVGVMRGTATLAGGALALKALDVMGLLGWTAATF